MNQREITKSNITQSFNRPVVKNCTANIILNSKGEILLLKRSPNDSFWPSVWCLPGGGLDIGELPIEGVKRETIEEAGIDSDCYKIFDYINVKVTGANLHYFLSVLSEKIDPFVVLDEAEHCNYEWCSPEDWSDKELILDLKEHLLDIFKLKYL